MSILNAAVWFGASLFYLVGVHPLFTSEEALQVIPLSHALVLSHQAMDRFFTLCVVCGFIAVIHVTVEWLYTGRPLRSGMISLALALFLYGLFGSYLVQPKMRQWHYQRLDTRQDPAIRARADKLYQFWNTTTTVLNTVLTASLFFYLWQVTIPREKARFNPTTRYRS